LIKNKTLHFLAKTLPYLKEDHENIPKVFKIAQTGYNDLYSNLESSPAPINYRAKRQASKATITKIEKPELNANDTSSFKSDNNDQNVSTSSTSSKKYKGVDSEPQLQHESRQKGCEQNDGM
jgi:hypothetical protein